ncbi:DUF4314 domain-containing protein [Mobilitalea sibirica]|uniref:DUF4314 domain-containing protein n=1 Tax=Mobilitalea sibirica TaxID=1462919 RepID=A0A8J7H3B4_9FIRM|nr:DUF4314 domain-containing protein [Mobilitalea sibirica]MBH1941310.1 DUF4314 domain-containing protein [Mobilitalea sibirica]
MRFSSREEVERIRKQYPIGIMVELVQMDDPQAPPIGTKGIVHAVDDVGNLIMKWENGSRLNVIIGEDIVTIIPAVTTICYGRKDTWKTRTEAEEFFLKAMMLSEGSERERYTKIYTELKMGMIICIDEEES